jgi:hypothetical protein
MIDLGDLVINRDYYTIVYKNNKADLPKKII